MSNNGKMTIHFVAKLRWVEKRPNEQMTIRNFEAMRLMCSSILHAKAEQWPQAKQAEADAKEILQDELKDYTAGQQLTVPLATARDGFGFGGLGGIQ